MTLKEQGHDPRRVTYPPEVVHRGHTPERIFGFSELSI